MHIPASNTTADLAGSEDLEHERQAVRDQLLRVLVLLDAAEVFEQALDERPAVLDEAGAQGLQPGVQRPGNTWEQNHLESEYTRGGAIPRNRGNHGSLVLREGRSNI